MQKIQNLNQTIILQQQASNPENSAWVFASAGSGKTKVLTDRVLRLLLSGVPANKIMCLTYTKAAANEMQNRIYQNLANWTLLKNDELENVLFAISGKKPTNNEIRTAQTLFIKILDEEAQLKIQTIHSFCQNLIKVFPFEAGINPNFEIIDEKKEKILLLKARKNILQKALLNEDLRNIVTSITSRLGDETLFGLINEFLDKKEQIFFLKEQFFNVENVTKEIFKTLKVDENESEENLILWLENQIKEDFEDLQNLAQDLENSQAKSDQNTKLAIQNIIYHCEQKSDSRRKGFVTPSSFSRNDEYGEGITNPFPQKQNVTHPTQIVTPSHDGVHFNQYKEAFLTKENEPRKTVITKTYQNDKNNNLILRQQKILQDFLEKQNSLQIAKSSAQILKLVDEIIQEYGFLKQKNSYLDYNDLITKTSKLLHNPEFEQWVKYKMDGFFDHILIDESQDTNEFQWNIIKAITEDFFSGFSANDKNRTIFIVGDEKQSIFSFQGANPYLAKEIHDYFAKKLQSYQSQLHKINLNSSFRSLKTILQITDKVFLKPENKAPISFLDEFLGHNQIKEGIGRFELLPCVSLKKQEKIGDDSGWKIDFTIKENYGEQEFLAEIIALKIKDWIDNSRIIESKNRPIKYSDIMILLRKRSNGFDKVLNKFLQKHQIPCNSSKKITLTDHIIIADLLSLAKFCLLQNDDLSLAESLKSPIFNLEDEDLLEICLIKNRENINLFAALKKIERFNQVKVTLEEFIAKSREFSAFEYFNFILNYQKTSEKIISRLSRNNEEEIKSVLKQLLNLALEFEKTSALNLQEFINYLEKLEPQSDVDFSKSAENKVKITTIHSAKGLQAPIIMALDCAADFGRMQKDKIFWINNLPFWLTNRACENNFIKIHKDFRDQQLENENLRLLYVAMTRAEDELYFGGFGKISQNSWYKKIADSLDESEIKKEEFLSENIKEKLKEKLDLFEIEPFSKMIGKEYIFAKKTAENEEIRNLELPEFLQNPEKNIVTKKSNESSSIKAHQGILIHKILEIIGKFSKNSNIVDKKYLNDLALKIIKRDQILQNFEQKEIELQISKFINSEIFDELFNKNNRYEIPVSGFIEGKFINNRIDLLVIKENEILIIDYKSDENPKIEIPQEYAVQLTSYKKLLKNLYQQHKISCAIFWTKSLQISYL